jgi:hypothetical protein
MPPTIRYDSTLIEMFGFSETPAPVAATTAVLPAPDPLPGLPALKEMRRPTDPVGDTGALVTRLWAATETTPLIDDWKPSSFDTLAASGRTFRWPIVVAAIAILLGGLALIRTARDMPERAAAEAAASYLQVTNDYASLLPDMDATAAIITDPTSDTSSLSDTAVSLSTFDQHARSVFDAAADPLPSTLPLVSRAPLDALTPIRRSMANAAEIGLTLERRLGDTLSYRLVLAKAFQLPELPTTATQKQIATLGVSLGLAVTSTTGAVTELPDEPFLSDHKIAVTQLAQRLNDWQIEYLEALRTGDQIEASTLIEEITQRVDALETGLDNPLSAIGDWARTQIGTLRTQLDVLTERR